VVKIRGYAGAENSTSGRGDTKVTIAKEVIASRRQHCAGE